MRWSENFSRKNGALAQRFKIKRWRTSRWRQLKKRCRPALVKKNCSKKTFGAVLQYNYFEYFNKLLFPNLQPWPWVRFSLPYNIGLGLDFSFLPVLVRIWLVVTFRKTLYGLSVLDLAKNLNPDPDPERSWIRIRILAISLHYLKKKLNYFIIITFQVFIIKRSQLKERML